MAMDVCKCGNFVDTDSEPEAYLLTPDSVGKPAREQNHVCLCWQCREELTEEELERRTP